MPKITPELVPRVAEYQPFTLQFVVVPEANEVITSSKIIEWDEDGGVEVNENRLLVKGRYENAFILNDNNLKVRVGNEYQVLKSWDIEEPSKTDVYYWKSPTHSVYMKYTIEVKYTIQSSSESSNDRAVSSSGSKTIQITKYQEVYPNWDNYADKLREQIEIRRLTWQDGDDILWQE